MLIGELSSRTGLSRDTIRFYEKKGLIDLPHRTRRENQYKEYPEQTVDRVLLVMTIKDLGFTLAEISNFFIQMDEESAPCEKLLPNLESKVSQIDRKIEELLKVRQRLSDSLNKCYSNQCEFEKKG